jgi:mono/diheme cytochrome c family protein
LSIFRSAFWAVVIVGLACVSLAQESVAGEPGAEESAFGPVFEMLNTHCGRCHRRGGASSWIVDMPPTANTYPACIGVERQYQCTTHLQLVEVPGADIPAWVRPEQAASSEPYLQACDAQGSYHVGVSLPAVLPDQECRRFLDWIIGGARP